MLAPPEHDQPRAPRLPLRRARGSWPLAWRGLALGLLASAVWRGVAALGWMASAESHLQDRFFRLRGAREGSPSIILVAVDDATIEREGVFPLPRQLHARVVDSLSRAGAKTIAFDTLFSESSPSPEDDRALEQACARAGNVIQPMVFGAAQRFAKASPPLPASSAVSEDAREPAVSREGVRVTPPQAALGRSAAALGHVNAYPDPDGIQRRQSPLVRYSGRLYPSLALAAAAHFAGLRPGEVVARGYQVLVGSKILELDNGGEVGINWAGEHGAFPTYSYIDVLDERVPAEVLRGRIVLVGSSATGSYDQRATPVAAVQTGLDVQANALSDILLGSSLRSAPAWATELALLLLPGALGASVAAWGRARALALGVASLAGVAALSALALAWGFSWPVATLLCAMATSLALVGASNSRRAWEASWRAQVAVETLARGGSLLSSATQFSQAPSSSVGALLAPEASVPEAARADLGSVASQTLAQALGSPLVLWLRDSPAPILAASPSPWAQAQQPLAAASSQALRALAARASGLDSARVESLAPPRERGAAASGSELSDAARAAASALEESAPAWALGARLGRQVLVAPLRREPGGAGCSGALVAFAPRHASWGAGEEALARAVAEQALLALANVEFTHALAGRVEAADRELREAYAVVFEQSAKLSAALEGIDDALLITDGEGRLSYANAATRPVLRHAAPSVGQSVPQVLEEHGLGDLARGFASLASLKDDERERAEATLAVREGEVESTRVLSSQLVALRDIEGRPMGALLMVADATAQRQIDRMKTDFVAYVAHELRTPLTTVLGYSSLLQQMGEGMDESQRAHMSGVIIQHCQKLNRMISELLDTASLDSGGTLALRLEPTDLAALAQRLAEEMAQSRSGNSRLRIEFEAPKRPLTAEADADRLEQVLANLLSNAVKYSPHGGRVLVQVLEAQGGHEAVIKVSDEGMGMSEEQLSHLFAKFYRTPDAQESGIKGTGLGLFLVRQLVQAHGGRVEVESSPGKGTAFSVFLPRKQASSYREWALDGRPRESEAGGAGAGELLS